MYKSRDPQAIELLTQYLTRIVSETNGISLADTLELAASAMPPERFKSCKKPIQEFRKLLASFQQDEVDISTLLAHPISDAMKLFLGRFPLPYKEEHIHLTGSLSADFIYPRLKELLDGENRELYLDKLRAVYGKDFKGIESVEDVDRLIRLKENEAFDRYLEILLPAKLILTSRQAHREAAYHMANELYIKYNVGQIRLKFTLSRASSNEADQIPGHEDLTEEDVVLGLYDGFMDFKQQTPSFGFILSPCFRKESDHFDSSRYDSKPDHFLAQVDAILELLDRYPKLRPHLTDVDTVGNEKDLYRKRHFKEMQQGFRKLHFRGISIRSHHGETWHTLRKGVQAVDNSMNIWHIDTLEHGLSLGINPNYYYHSLYQRIMELNHDRKGLGRRTQEYKEIMDMEWRQYTEVRDKLVRGEPLCEEDRIQFIKIKFHTAREVEHYQHDVLNRMINKEVSLIALPSSNNKLTDSFPDYKDHPFSWWEKKGVKLGIGTDNYVTLNTDYLQELLILLYTDPDNLKITKLLMVATGEGRRAFLSHYLWSMREDRQYKVTPVKDNTIGHPSPSKE